MKRIIAFLVLSVATISCYDEYLVDYDYSSVYFVRQINVRTFIVGEGMKIEIGASLGGVRENSIDRNVDFTIDNSLITPSILTAMQAGESYIKNAVATVTTLSPMPTNYYTLSNSNRIVIKEGQHMGSVVMKPDSAVFLADPKTSVPNYAIALYITKADADTILSNKQSVVIGLKYENMLYGNYWHGGSALVIRPGKADTTINYYTTIPQLETKVWNLKTVGPNTLYANGYLDQKTSKNEMMLALNGNDITISTVAGSTWTIVPDGASSFNRPKLLQNRKIFLKYSFVNTSNGYTYKCTDTLTFRNRIRDGLNEWQDENLSHYLK